MATFCRAFSTDDAAHAAVDRLLAAGTPDTEIRLVTAQPIRDHRDAPVGGFAGEGGGGAVGSFAGAPRSDRDGMGGFAGEPAEQRVGGFGDLDRETVTSYRGGVRRVHVASHRKLERMLVDAGLDPAAAAADVDALHHGRVLVLVRTAAPAPGAVPPGLDEPEPVPAGVAPAVEPRT